MSKLAIVILAAGQGTRMHSKLPKVLHKAAGRELVRWVIEAGKPLSPATMVIVIGNGADVVRATLGDEHRFALQPKQLGTAHAVQQAVPLLPSDCQDVLVLYGDTPLLRSETLAQLVDLRQTTDAALAMLTGIATDPRGYGRIVRDGTGKFACVVEEADATEEQRAITEFNSGVCVFRTDFLLRSLPQVQPSSKGEFYLTSLVEMAVAKELPVETLRLTGERETAGINTREQLAEATNELHWRIRRRLMSEGITMIDPNSVYCDAETRIGQDTIVYPGTTLEGRTVIGSDCAIGPNTIMRDSVVGDRCRVMCSVLEDTTVGNDVSVGPFSHLRQNATLGSQVHIGNFAEIKNSELGTGSKMHHFSYLGDAQVGERVNIAAGTITCNFDAESGAKSRTVLEDDVALGSDTMLVAPVRVGHGAITGAGSVVTRDVAAESVVVGAPAKPIRGRRRGT